MPRYAALLFLTLATGCTAVAVEPRKADGELVQPPGTQRGEEAPSSEQILAHIRTLPESERRTLADAMGVLAVNCPYTRASLQLPLALQQLVSEVDANDLAEPHRTHWKALMAQLAAQVEVLDAIGVDLRMPAKSDHLHRAANGVLLTRAELAATAEPMRATMALIEANEALVEALDEPTRELIRDQTDLAYYRMGQTTLFHQTWASHRALIELLPHVSDEDLRKRLTWAIVVLDTHDGHGC